jgi:hypothetical protein
MANLVRLSFYMANLETVYCFSSHSHALKVSVMNVGTRLLATMLGSLLSVT